MGKWYDKWMLGNPNKPDFTLKDLPKTRFDLFIDAVKMHFLGMISLNLIYMLFLLPLILFSLMMVFVVINEIATLNTDSISTYLDTILKYLDFYVLIAVPLYTIAGPAKAGMHYVIRNWSWGEQANIRNEFWKEFKRSWKTAMLLNFITGLVIYATVFWVRLLLTPENVKLHPIFPYIGVFIAFMALIYLIASMFSFPQLVTYTLKTRQIIKNSFLFFIAQLPKVTLAALCFLSVLALCYLFKGISVVIFLTMGVSFIVLAKTIFCGYVFDKYLNTDDQLKRKGMAPTNKERK